VQIGSIGRYSQMEGVSAGTYDMTQWTDLSCYQLCLVSTIPLPFFRSVATVAVAGENGNAGNVFPYTQGWSDQNAEWLSAYGRTATEWWKPGISLL